MVAVATNWNQTTSNAIPNQPVQVPLLLQRCPKNAILLCLPALISYSCDLSRYKTCSVVEGSLIPSPATNFLSSQVRQVWTPCCCSLTQRERVLLLLHSSILIHPSIHLSRYIYLNCFVFFLLTESVFGYTNILKMSLDTPINWKCFWIHR